MGADFNKWLFETAKAQAKVYRESMEQKPTIAGAMLLLHSEAKRLGLDEWPSVETQQAHWQAKDDQEAEALRQQRECEQLSDVEREERDRDLENESRQAWESEHGPERDQSEGESDAERNA